MYFELGRYRTRRLRKTIKNITVSVTCMLHLLIFTHLTADNNFKVTYVSLILYKYPYLLILYEISFVSLR